VGRLSDPADVFLPLFPFSLLGVSSSVSHLVQHRPAAAARLLKQRCGVKEHQGLARVLTSPIRALHAGQPHPEHD